MTAIEFVKLWTGVTLSERSSAQQHFLTLCDLLEHPWPVKSDKTGAEFTFEKGAKKPDGSDGWADVWKRGFFGWEYKKRKASLEKAYDQLLRYKDQLENPPLLVVSDTDRIVVHTNFTNTPHRKHEVLLTEIGNSESLRVLRAVFENPEALRPTETRQVITEKVARSIADLAKQMRSRNLPAEKVARFLDRVVFCMFAEDVELLPRGLFSRLAAQTQGNPSLFRQLTSELFQKMNEGGHFGLDRIRHFNGSLFEENWVPELSSDELAAIWKAAIQDWSSVDPSILGTLFERGLDPDVRAKLGAHYTGYADIVTLVEPVVLWPLRREWDAVRAQAIKHLDKGTRKARKDAADVVDAFLQRLAAVRVLDPACGSGNFLYVTLQRLKDLEKEANDWSVERDIGMLRQGEVGPWQLHGIELNQYAHELARMTVWIGYLQWRREHGYGDFKEPILRATDNFLWMDALLKQPNREGQAATEPDWPDSDFIIGNPPFLGSRLMRKELGEEYTDLLFHLYKGRIPNSSDLCCYFFEKALSKLKDNPALRVGLLATQGIRGQASRKVLEKITEAGGIFFAVSDRDWTLDGANVHVSLIGFDGGLQQQSELDGKPVAAIHPDLTAGHDTTTARRLIENQGISFYADVKAGKFDLSEQEAMRMMFDPNPNRLPNSDVLLPYINTLHVTRRSPFTWVIDFDEMTSEEAMLYQLPFEYVERNVRSKRAKQSRPRYRDNWWLHAEPCHEMRKRIWKLPRFLVTSSTAKHRVFAWQTPPTLPDHAVIAFAISDDYRFGILQSRFHEVWSVRVGSQLRERKSGFRYTPTTCFETFPFPDPTPDQVQAIETAACELNERRQEWLNPSIYVVQKDTFFPASKQGRWGSWVEDDEATGADVARFTRLEPKNSAGAALVKERTLTNLYNTIPAWLKNCHDILDATVAAAYGWPPSISDNDVIGKLLELNQNKEAVSKKGR